VHSTDWRGGGRRSTYTYSRPPTDGKARKKSKTVLVRGIKVLSNDIMRDEKPKKLLKVKVDNLDYFK